MQTIMGYFLRAYTVFGLSITMEMNKNTQTPRYVGPNIFVQVQSYEIIHVYLGSTLARDGSLDQEINLIIEKVSETFGKLEKRIWSDRHFSLDTIINFY